MASRRAALPTWPKWNAVAARQGRHRASAAGACAHPVSLRGSRPAASRRRTLPWLRPLQTTRLPAQMNPPPLAATDFSAFFSELWGSDCDPFPWQREFARRLCAGQVPDYVAVPTGSGKTACLDAAVFALAVQAALPMAERTQGRRIFFIVNRR